MNADRPAPAYYALRRGGWRDYVTLLHLPYTAWHLSYVVLGATISSRFDGGRFALAFIAFALAVGVAAHALDELKGRPLRTRIPDGALWAMAAASLLGAAGVGAYAAATITVTIVPFIAAGVFLVLAYNLEWFEGRFHTDRWFAIAWGVFPVLTTHWAMVSRIEPAGIAAAAAAYALTAAQRVLSTPARELRRRTRDVAGTLTRHDGSQIPLDARRLGAPLEAALRALSWAMIALAAALLWFRWAT